MLGQTPRLPTPTYKLACRDAKFRVSTSGGITKNRSMRGDTGASTFGRNTKRLEIAATQTKSAYADYLKTRAGGFSFYSPRLQSEGYLPKVDAPGDTPYSPAVSFEKSGI